MRITLLLASLAFAATARAAQYTIAVGMDEAIGAPGNGFDPSRTVIAGQNSTQTNTIVFTFQEGVHQVVQSEFSSPCAASGWTSGVINGTDDGSGPTSTFQITNNSAVYYFSDLGDTGSPCWQGAVFCVNTNENDPQSSCAAFKTAALAVGAQHGVYDNSTTSTLPVVPPATVVSTHSVVSSTSASAASHAVSTSSTSPSPSTTTKSSKKSSGTQERETSVLSAFGATVVGLVAALAF
ncbi:hypothetical protein JCM1840_003096 [Sporobolomyces johnsonii]